MPVSYTHLDVYKRQCLLTSHSMSAPSALPAIRVLPSGVNARDRIQLLLPFSWGAIYSPVTTSQSAILPSVPAVANTAPSGLKAATRARVFPLDKGGCRLSPLATSHKIEVLSKLAEASRFASGLNTMSWIDS